MKKIKLCIAGLLLSGMTYSQTVTTPVIFDEREISDMIADLDDILEWQQQDIEEAQSEGKDCSCGSYEEGWGSNYWLTIMKEKLELKLRTRNSIKVWQGNL